MVSPSGSTIGCLVVKVVGAPFVAVGQDNYVSIIDIPIIRYEAYSVIDATSGSDSSMTTPSYYEKLLDTWPRQKVPLEVFNAFMELYRRAVR